MGGTKKSGRGQGVDFWGRAIGAERHSSAPPPGAAGEERKAGLPPATVPDGALKAPRPGAGEPAPGLFPAHLQGRTTVAVQPLFPDGRRARPVELPFAAATFGELRGRVAGAVGAVDVGPGQLAAVELVPEGLEDPIASAEDALHILDVLHQANAARCAELVASRAESEDGFGRR